MLQTALATFVLFSPAREPDPRRVAMSFAILLLPYSLVGPFAGMLIDRWSRRTILIRANVVRASAMIAICLVINSHDADMTLAVLVLITLGVNRFTQASLSASLPHVVLPSELVTANALFPTLGTVCASLAAGVGIATQKLLGNYDSTNALLVLIASGLAMSAAVTGKTIEPRDLLGPHGVSGKVLAAMGNVVSGLLDGLNAIRRAPLVLRAMGAVALQRFAFGVLTVHVLLLARTVWHPPAQPDGAVTDFGFAAIAAAAGSGIAALVSASLLSGNRINRVRAVTKTAWVTCLVSTPVMALALYSQERLAVIATAGILGCAGQFLKIAADTCIQQSVNDAHRGRAFSLFDMLINLSIVSGIGIYSMNSQLRQHSIPTLLVIATAVVCAAFLERDVSGSTLTTTE
jgi:MFS family permease